MTHGLAELNWELTWKYNLRDTLHDLMPMDLSQPHLCPGPGPCVPCACSTAGCCPCPDFSMQWVPSSRRESHFEASSRRYFFREAFLTFLFVPLTMELYFCHNSRVKYSLLFFLYPINLWILKNPILIVFGIFGACHIIHKFRGCVCVCVCVCVCLFVSPNRRIKW